MMSLIKWNRCIKSRKLFLMNILSCQWFLLLAAFFVDSSTDSTDFTEFHGFLGVSVRSGNRPDCRLQNEFKG
jgi:hypothetical protein